jgi:hypothetical protein
MTRGHSYRVRAAEFIERAKTTTDPIFQIEHARMAAAYLRLAEQADRRVSTEAEQPAEKPAAR